MNDAQNDGRQRNPRHNIAKWSNHLCVFLLCPFHTAEELPFPTCIYQTTQKEQKQMQQVIQELMDGVIQIKFDMHCVGGKFLFSINTFAMRVNYASNEKAIYYICVSRSSCDCLEGL
jgi:hypothetical protein